MNSRATFTYFKQFPTVTGIRLLSAKIIQKFLDPYCVPSYSQTGEDRILATLLDHKPIGFYVDVGCYRPHEMSNTFELYKKGWRGINIDANPTVVREQRKVRPRDTHICCAISSEKREMRLTRFRASPAVSSISQGHVEAWKKHLPAYEEIVVTTRTLQEVLSSCGAPHAFDLLLIDVEGHDFEVLKSLDLNCYRPHLIVVEMHNVQIDQMASNPIYRYLISCDYNVMGYVTMNGYFMDRRTPVSKIGIR